MNKIKITILLLFVSIVMPVGAQEKDPKVVQQNIDDIFILYEKMESKIKIWSKSKTEIGEDSIKLFVKEDIKTLLNKLDTAEKYASPTQNVLVQFYAIQTYSAATDFLRSNGNKDIALFLNQDYHKLLSFSSNVNGIAFSNGVLRNISMEKINVAQFRYLYNLYVLANEANDKKLLLYTSKNIVSNKRAGLYDQSISALYLFDVAFAQNDFSNSFKYGEDFLTKFTNLSFENKNLVIDRTDLENQRFVKNFYHSGVELLHANKKALNAQNVSKYSVIGEKYSIPNLGLYMQALLTEMGQIEGKSKIEDLYNQSKKLEDTTLSSYFKQKLNEIKK